jgi:hypothetical protein
VGDAGAGAEIIAKVATVRECEPVELVTTPCRRPTARPVLLQQLSEEALYTGTSASKPIGVMPSSSTSFLSISVKWPAETPRLSLRYWRLRGRLWFESSIPNTRQTAAFCAIAAPASGVP